jgi:hypothetical protein
MIRIVAYKIVIILASKRLAIVNNNKMMEIKYVTDFHTSVVLKRDRNDWPFCDSVFEFIESGIYV